jgi:uncharacterized membrane protein YcaP (DUF421 family)
VSYYAGLFFFNIFAASEHNMNMLIIFTRAVVLFTILLIVIRLMGKRQIGEMEPFELVITLVISELACIPMADKSIPLTYGVVAILSMFIIHQLIVALSKIPYMQKLLSGKPVLVIDKNGISDYALRKLNMQVNDLLQVLRNAGYFSLEEVDYGLMETNGQLSIIPKKNMQDKQKTLPIPVIMDGKWNTEEGVKYSISKEKVEQILAKHHLRISKVNLFTVDSKNHVVIQPKKRPVFVFDLKEGEELI